jgi:uncharacterized protein (TIGR00725 family)
VPGAPYVAVVGPGDAQPAEVDAAEQIGGGLVERLGAVVVTGGLGGVMEAACRGARSRRGTSLGLLPGADREAANGWVEIAVPTGMGELRNGLIVRASDAVVAVGGGPGTLSEIAFALKLGRPVIGLGTWDVHGVQQAASPGDALERVAAALTR